MENTASIPFAPICIRPAARFAFIKILPFLIGSIAFLWVAWHFWPPGIVMSLFTVLLGVYRYLYIRKIRYTITGEYLQVRRGLFFLRTDMVELFRVKDYVLTQPFLLQLLQLMDLQLVTTDPVNPQLWLRGIPLSDLVDKLRARVLETRRYNRIYEVN